MKKSEGKRTLRVPKVSWEDNIKVEICSSCMKKSEGKRTLRDPRG